MGYTLDLVRDAVTTESLRGSQLVYFRAPNGTFTESEKAAIVAHVNKGGSLLLVLDEEKRQSLAKTGVNDILAPFGMKLSGDTPRIVNTGAIATNVQSLNGTTIDTNTGNASAGTQRVVLATNQPNLTTALNVALPGTSAMNLAQVGSGTVATAGTGIQKVAIVDSSGANILATADPCSGSNVANFTVATTTANTPVALVTGTAGVVTYICGVHIQGNTANDTVAVIVEGTTTCSAGTPTALDGSSTTASNGFRIAGGGGGFTTGFGGATVYKTPSANRDICGSTSTSDRVIWSGTYIKQ